jgi:hypothetical protein
MTRNTGGSVPRSACLSRENDRCGGKQRIALVADLRSSATFAVEMERGWKNPKIYSDVGGDYTRDYSAVTPTSRGSTYHSPRRREPGECGVKCPAGAQA